MDFSIPDGFFEGRIAVRCGRLVQDFWDYVVFNCPECRSRPLSKEKIFEMTQRYNDRLTIACIRTRGVIGWCDDQWYQIQGLKVVDIDECIVEPREVGFGSVDQMLLHEVLFTD